MPKGIWVPQGIAGWELCVFMNNYSTIKKVIIAATVLVALAVSYYFVIFLPQRNDDARVFASNQKCKDEGENIYKEDKIKREMNQPEYIFNKKLNTCLYSSGWSNCDKDICVIYSFVKDSLTNKTIIYSSVVADKSYGLSGEEFKKQKQEFFDQ